METEEPSAVVQFALGVILSLVVLGPMLLAFYKLAIRHLIQHARARRELPQLAAELSLQHHRSREPKGIGALTGRYRGLRVSIMPDASESSAKLQVHLEKDVRVVLTRSNWGGRRGMETIEFPDRRLNRYFKTRLAPPELAKRLSQPPTDVSADPTASAGGYRDAAREPWEPDVASVLGAFVATWGKQLTVCELNRNAFGCSPVVGSGENVAQSVSVDQVRALLPDMIEVARALDALHTAAASR